MRERAHRTITCTLAGLLLTTGCATGTTATTALRSAPVIGPNTSPSARPSTAASTTGSTTGSAARSAARSTSPAGSSGQVGATAQPTEQAETFPSGIATATSFWDAETASGKPMRYQTIASPYWPLGTKVKITYDGRSVTGFVEDFGPAEWAVAQHDIPAIVDLSEEMMADLTGVRSTTVHVRFEVLKWGTGPVYRTFGTGYELAMGEL